MARERPPGVQRGRPDHNGSDSQTRPDQCDDSYWYRDVLGNGWLLRRQMARSITVQTAI